MTLRSILIDVTSVVLILTVLGLVTIVGVDRVRSFPNRAVSQIRRSAPYLVLLGGVLLVNSYLREIGPSISWIIGFRITETIIALEGTFVANLQSYSHPVLNYYFSYIYIYVYTFIMVFPIVAYLLHTDDRPIREAVLAYTLNYGIGVVCYVMFISFGPRNAGPEFAQELLYTHWPESQLLTSEVNANVNVFPSLHSSLSATVALLAYRWRDIYWAWFPIATFLAISVALSTMYLGIHWATDVVAGLVLAGISVGIAIWLSRPERKDGRLGRLGCLLRRPIDYVVDFVIRQVRTLIRRHRTGT